jgi:hypothetical protein
MQEPALLQSEAVGMPDHGGGHRDYDVYGIKLRTTYSIRSRMVAGAGPPEVRFDSTFEAPGVASSAMTDRLGSADRKEGFAYLDQAPGVDILNMPGLSDWYFFDNRILCHLPSAANAWRVEPFLLGTALPYWLEKQGRPSLHASAVAIDGRAVGFLANNRGGKTSLALSLMAAGYPLITDDILPLVRSGNDFFGQPGYPQVRLWPGHAEALLGDCTGFEFVHHGKEKYRIPLGEGTGAFTDGPALLSAIYLPARGRTSGVDIEPVASTDALKELLRKSFVPWLAERARGPAPRLSFLAALIRNVPIRRIEYPNGIEHLPAVRDAILNDLIYLKEYRSQ